MNKLTPILPLTALLVVACIEDQPEDVFSRADAIQCDVDADCPSGQECEIEHGDAFCKPHGSDDGSGGATGSCQVDADCPAGLECEIEHGQSYCKPHGGDGTGGGSVGACMDDADCPAGQECEFEHGQSYCKPHGGQ